MTTYTPHFNLPIRCMFIECQNSILDKYNIPTSDRLPISNVWYLVLRVDSSDYTRVEKGNRSELVGTRTGDFILPSSVKVGFQIRMVNQRWNVFQCLSFVATSSISTAYNSFVPVTIIDGVRPEIFDVSNTIRKGRMSVTATGGTNGSGVNNAPLYIEGCEISFEELNTRLLG